MSFNRMMPQVLCIEAERNELDTLTERCQAVFSDYAVVGTVGAEQGLKKLDEMVMNREEIAMIITTLTLPDAKGEHVLVKAYEKWPNALRLLLLDSRSSLDFVLYEQAKVFRAIRKPIDAHSFTGTLNEALQFYQQRQELIRKNKIVTELHRASLTLTGERDFNRLLHKLMRIVIDNADAQCGYIVLRRDLDESLFIEASGTAGSYETDIRTIEVTDFSPVCPAIAEFARKAGESVLLHDAFNEGVFASHPFIRKNLCRSILCTPLIYQGQFFGLLYLDNPQKTHAFSEFDIELLRLLSAPAAVALQNAKLYTELEQMVVERTTEVVRQKQEIERQRDLIQEKNNDIMDSIRYAKRIQDAILPKIQDVKKVFPQAFIYFHPKDIVSGDFYWYSRRLSKNIIAVADCTGHGIPGAFMTVMANTLLKQIVELEGIFKPNEILLQLHLRMRISLQQHEDSNQKDGLDMALCQFDANRNKLQFAGAGRNLIIIRNKEIIEVKGDKFGVGGDQEEESREYTNHTIELENGDMIYLFSDGYPDQIGEEINRKFLYKRFYNLLLEIHSKDPDHQKMLLDAELRYWRGDQEQTDDITVIGIRIGEEEAKG